MRRKMCGVACGSAAQPYEIYTYFCDVLLMPLFDHNYYHKICV